MRLMSGVFLEEVEESPAQQRRCLSENHVNPAQHQSIRASQPATLELDGVSGLNEQQLGRLLTLLSDPGLGGIRITQQSGRGNSRGPQTLEQ